MEIIQRTNRSETVVLNKCGEIVERNPLETIEYVEMLAGGKELPLVKIPVGVFDMGCLPQKGGADESPRHNVLVKQVYMSKYPVTQGQWSALITKEAPFRKRGDDYPANRISWNAAGEFCRAMSKCSGRSYRLPSEAEWEYACRANTVTPFYFGETITTDFVNFVGLHRFADEPKGVYRGGPTEKDQFPPNSFGLHDMHGNVWEWCEDTWHDNYDGAPLNEKPWVGGDSSWRVMRGGCWHDPPGLCRSSSRLKARAEEGEDYFGFRVVVSAL